MSAPHRRMWRAPSSLAQLGDMKTVPEKREFKVSGLLRLRIFQAEGGACFCIAVLAIPRSGTGRAAFRARSSKGFALALSALRFGEFSDAFEPAEKRFSGLGPGLMGFRALPLVWS